MISGKLTSYRGSKHQAISVLIRALEQAHCEVARHDDTLVIEMPGLDAQVLPSAGRLPMVRWFWDRWMLRLDDNGGIYFRTVYWTWPQLAMHAAITLLIAMEYCFGSSVWTFGQFLLNTLVANAIPTIITAINALYMFYKVLGPVRTKLLAQDPTPKHELGQT